jgi:hypothetical protein
MSNSDGTARLHVLSNECLLESEIIAALRHSLGEFDEEVCAMEQGQRRRMSESIWQSSNHMHDRSVLIISDNTFRLLFLSSLVNGIFWC